MTLAFGQHFCEDHMICALQERKLCTKKWLAMHMTWDFLQCQRCMPVFIPPRRWRWLVGEEEGEAWAIMSTAHHSISHLRKKSKHHHHRQQHHPPPTALAHCDSGPCASQGHQQRQKLHQQHANKRKRKATHWHFMENHRSFGTSEWLRCWFPANG